MAFVDTISASQILNV